MTRKFSSFLLGSELRTLERFEVRIETCSKQCGAYRVGRVGACCSDSCHFFRVIVSGRVFAYDRSFQL